ncbi:hypothetical protein Busp01_39150 [Trinickia caryophylli]|uniref:Uncharacterized protein n=1 Tax=Trinickia caryophylli TaxID=28094 RepID=A0A1X7FJL7_TRICW|nr:hypothetical protein Busp01_39150 [Trinickia caryophylli]SMF53337.1 hypothetical protein SAMN06295900_109113 [Trinickia caryophylli]
MPSNPASILNADRTGARRYSPSEVGFTYSDEDAASALRDFASVASHLGDHASIARDPVTQLGNEDMGSRYEAMTERLSRLWSDRDVRMSVPGPERDRFVDEVRTLVSEHSALRHAIEFPASENEEHEWARSDELVSSMRRVGR